MSVNPTGPDSPANVKRLTSAEMMARSEELLGQAYDEVSRENRFCPPDDLAPGEWYSYPPLSADKITHCIQLGQGYALLALAKLKAGPPR